MTRVAAPANGAADAALMLRIKADDGDAFNALYDRFAARAYGVAYAIARDIPLAQDIVQEAFLSLWRSRARYDPEQGAVASWLLGIVRNRAIDGLRRQGRHDSRRAGQYVEGQVAATDDVSAAIGDRDRATRLRAALDRLPVAQRDVITLAYYGELTHTEIASRLDLPEGTVKGRMRLGLAKLREAALAGEPPRHAERD